MNLNFTVHPDSLAFKYSECLICHQAVRSKDWSGFNFMPCCTTKVHVPCHKVAMLPYEGRCYFCGDFPNFSAESPDIGHGNDYVITSYMCISVHLLTIKVTHAQSQ